MRERQPSYGNLVRDLQIIREAGEEDPGTSGAVVLRGSLEDIWARDFKPLQSRESWNFVRANHPTGTDASVPVGWFARTKFQDSRDCNGLKSRAQMSSRLPLSTTAPL